MLCYLMLFWFYGTYYVHVFATETYVMQTVSRSRRSFLAQFRIRILPLEIENRLLLLLTIKTNYNFTRNDASRSLVLGMTVN